MARFSSLPDELIDLIFREICDYKSIFLMTLLSKNCYDIFNRRLYEFIDLDLDEQIHTLALSQGERLPLTGPHPASLVKNLQLEFSRSYDVELTEMEIQEEETKEEVFRRKAASVLNSVVQHGAILHSLILQFPRIPLHEMIRNVDSATFGNLRTLVVLVQYDILESPNLEIFESLCQRSPFLTRLDLQWAIFDDVIRWLDFGDILFKNPVGVSRLLKRLPQLCPNLKEIRLGLLDPGQSYEILQRVLDDPSFTFPLLQNFHCGNFLRCNLYKFFLRHPEIVKLNCFDITIGDARFQTPVAFLPNIRYLSSYVSDYVTLCTKHPPPIECLDLIFSSDLNAQEKTYFISGLSHTKTLRQLALDQFPSAADTLVLLDSIIKACPKLTHLQCKRFGKHEPSIVSDLYSTILHNLPNLEHLLLQFQCSSEPADNLFYTPHLQVLSGHRFLKTIEISIYCAKRWRTLCFAKEKGIVIAVPLLRDNRFFS